MAADPSSPSPYLGMNCRSPSTRGELVLRWLWLIVEATLFRWSPRPWHGWRARLLVLFGATIKSSGKVVVFPTASIHFPWKLELHDRSMIGPRVTIYNLARVTLEYGANVSQKCALPSVWFIIRPNIFGNQ